MTTTLPLSQPALAPRPSPAVVSAVSAASAASAMSPISTIAPVKRISSAGLMDGGREVEIEHCGRVYRLRVTQLNKLILTA